MYRDTPSQRLWLAKQRQSELIGEAEQYRLARSGARNRAADRPNRIAAFATSLGRSVVVSATWLGRSVVAMRRPFSGYDTVPRQDTCLDADPC